MIIHNYLVQLIPMQKSPGKKQESIYVIAWSKTNAFILACQKLDVNPKNYTAEVKESARVKL